MKPFQSLLLFVFTVLSIHTVSAQYGNGYGGGYNNGYGRGGGGMDRSMMNQSSQQQSKPKETPVEEVAAQIVEQMKPEVNLDELQAIAITNVLAESIREQGILLKNENSSQDQKMEQIKALREETNKKVNAFLNPDQKDKYTSFMENFKEVKKSKSKKKKNSKEETKETLEETSKPTE